MLADKRCVCEMDRYKVVVSHLIWLSHWCSPLRCRFWANKAEKSIWNIKWITMLFPHLSSVQLSQSLRWTVRFSIESTIRPQPQSKDTYVRISVSLFSFIYNLIRWITLSILTFGCTGTLKGLVECLPHIVWNSILWWKTLSSKQKEALQSFWFVLCDCQCKEIQRQHQKETGRRKPAPCVHFVCTTHSNFVTDFSSPLLTHAHSHSKLDPTKETQELQSIDLQCTNNVDCDSFVDNVFINISALVHIDMIIDAVNFVIEIRASGGCG